MHEIIHKKEYGEDRVSGYVNGREVICLGTHSDRASTVQMSTALPSVVEHARKILQCYVAAFQKLDEIEAAAKPRQDNGFYDWIE